MPIASTAVLARDKSQSKSAEIVAAILIRCKTALIADWWARTKNTPGLNHLHFSDEECTGHLPKLVDDLVARLCNLKFPDKDGDAISSPAAIEHGKLRRTQGYSSGMLIDESRILRVAVFGTLQKKNLSMLDFNLLFPDVMIVANEVDVQLTQTTDAFTKAEIKKAWQPEGGKQLSGLLFRDLPTPPLSRGSALGPSRSH
jgi:hypothetical protein